MRKNDISRSKGKGVVVLLAIMTLLPLNIFAQKNQESAFNRDTLISAAKKLMTEARYCALITLDKSGNPQVRTMDPFSPEEDMVIWLGTNSESRKVKEIDNDSRVSLYYEAPDASGYVVLKGRASLVNDPQQKHIHWKPEWENFYSAQKSEYLLIKVVPDRLEIIDYRHGIVSKSKKWTVPYVDF